MNALNTALSGMDHAAQRVEDLAIGIANPTAEHAPQPARAAEKPIKPEEPIAPVSASPSADYTRQLTDLHETELAFKASALVARTALEASQELMDALR